MPAEDLYRTADEEMSQAEGCAIGFTQLLGRNPYVLPRSAYESYNNRFDHIRCFQQRSLDIFKAALANEIEPCVARWLLNDAPPGLRRRYHLSLQDEHFTLPVFFRTDEVCP